MINALSEHHHTLLKTMQYSEKKQWLRRFHRILDRYLSEISLDNEQIAELIGMSERQFYRKVKAITKLAPNQYIRSYRLEVAKTYLEQGRYRTVREISFAVGYANVGYFNQQFKEKFGKTPLNVLKEYGWR